MKCTMLKGGYRVFNLFGLNRYFRGECQNYIIYWSICDLFGVTSSMGFELRASRFIFLSRVIALAADCLW